MSGGESAPDGNLTACKTLAASLQAENDAGASWDKIGTSRHVSGGLAYRIAKEGYEPRTARIRAALGLAPNITRDGATILAAPRECACGCGVFFIPRTANQKRLAGHPRRRNR